LEEERAWDKQSLSLIEVQKFGSQLEKRTRDLLGWEYGRIIYDSKHDYKLQVDASWPSLSSPRAILSVTYTNPDQPGHSNENKLHLKIGELALLKHAFPGVGIILIIGGTRKSWLPYVLEAFKYFFDEVIFLWDAEKALKRIKEIKQNPQSISKKNEQLWNDLSLEWDKVDMISVGDPVPFGLVRYKIADSLRKENRDISHPKFIRNEISRLCMLYSFKHGGVEWEHFKKGRWERIEMSRNYFNPVEAAVEIILLHFGFRFKGGVGKDVEVSSLLHKFGLTRTKISEDFVLHSKKLNCPIYIQCKSSGGGRKQHGKNIQNRTKEQITRSLLYRCGFKEERIVWLPKRFHWISILDGNWGVSKEQPAKYVHMLQWAGYDKIIGSEDLLTSELSVKRENNPLANYLKSLDCNIL
jgi:hypothetical protein